MKRKLLRQGDVLLVPVDSADLSGTAPVARDKGRVVLAYGEVTGHAHAILDPEVELFSAPVPEGSTAESVDRWLRVNSATASLVHEEHATLTLSEGLYKVIRQREYAPEAVRFVAD